MKKNKNKKQKTVPPVPLFSAPEEEKNRVLDPNGAFEDLDTIGFADFNEENRVLDQQGTFEDFWATPYEENRVLDPNGSFEDLDTIGVANDFEATGFTDYTKICLYAAEWGDLATVRSLIPGWLNSNEILQQSLERAALNGHLAVFKYLIERGANVKFKSEEHPLPAQVLAIQNGHLNIAQYLIEEGLLGLEENLSLGDVVTAKRKPGAAAFQDSDDSSQDEADLSQDEDVTRAVKRFKR